MSTTFTELGLSDELSRALEARGITTPFPVQEASIPDGLAGRDIKGRAPTGSGKTLAFGLPLLSRVTRAGSHRPHALVLAPTRELAEQIKKDLAPLAREVGRTVEAIYGGVGYGPQIKSLRHGVDVLVATPGRLEDLLERGTVDLREVSIVVLDEADRMADMGFMPAVRRILDKTSPRRQTSLFSATLDGDVAVLSRDYQHDPIVVTSEPLEEKKSDVLHHFWRVDRNGRLGVTARLIGETDRSIVFTRTRHGADRLVKQLAQENVSAVAMHGGRSQSQRTRALRQFSTGQARALVATDVAARGIHVDGVDAVIHYDIAGDSKDYLHRSGRTARAGATGTVISLVVDGQEKETRKLQRELGLESPLQAPTFGVAKGGVVRAHSSGGPKGDDVSSSNGHQTGRRNRPEAATRRLVGDTSRPAERIFVGNIPWKTTRHELEAMFAQHGEVADVEIATRHDGRPRGYAIVNMPGHARNAIGALDGATLGGRRLTIRAAR